MNESLFFSSRFWNAIGVFGEGGFRLACRALHSSDSALAYLCPVFVGVRCVVSMCVLSAQFLRGIRVRTLKRTLKISREGSCPLPFSPEGEGWAGEQTGREKNGGQVDGRRRRERITSSRVSQVALCANFQQ